LTAFFFGKVIAEVLPKSSWQTRAAAAIKLSAFRFGIASRAVAVHVTRWHPARPERHARRRRRRPDVCFECSHETCATSPQRRAHCQLLLFSRTGRDCPGGKVEL